METHTILPNLFWTKYSEIMGEINNNQHKYHTKPNLRRTKILRGNLELPLPEQLQTNPVDDEWAREVCGQNLYEQGPELKKEKKMTIIDKMQFARHFSGFSPRPRIRQCRTVRTIPVPCRWLGVQQIRPLNRDCTRGPCSLLETPWRDGPAITEI